jgi:hypothetical protein
MYEGLIISSECEYVTCMYTRRGHNRHVYIAVLNDLEQPMATVYTSIYVHQNAFGPK